MQASCQDALTVDCIDMSIENPQQASEGSAACGVLFVCLGNICRSPLAEGLFRRAVDRAGRSAAFHIDSCGTSGWHSGEPPDPGSVAVAARHGVDISGQRSRVLTRQDLERFQWVVCLDASNKRAVQKLCASLPGEPPLLLLLRDVDPAGEGLGVPDPYAGSSEAFQECFEIIEGCMAPLLERVLHVKKASL